MNVNYNFTKALLLTFVLPAQIMFAAASQTTKAAAQSPVAEQQATQPQNVALKGKLLRDALWVGATIVPLIAGYAAFKGYGKLDSWLEGAPSRDDMVMKCMNKAIQSSVAVGTASLACLFSLTGVEMAENWLARRGYIDGALLPSYLPEEEF